MAQVITGTDNMGADITTAWIDCRNDDKVDLHLAIENNTDAAGSITIEGAVDKDTAGREVALGFQLQSDGSYATSIAVVAATNANHLIELVAPSPWVRIKFTDSTGGSGTGDLNAFAMHSKRSGRG